MTTTAIISTLLLLTNFLYRSEHVYIKQKTSQEQVKHAGTISVGIIPVKQVLSITDSATIKMYADNTVILFIQDTPPIYKYGGDTGLRKFISKNLRYPNEICVSGKVYVGFTVDIHGNVKNIKIMRGLSKETDKEVIRIVKMLTFIPGTKMGKPIDTKLTLPFNFNIQAQ